MELKPGYKQTELGSIPEDWDVHPLGQHVQITSGETPTGFSFTSTGVPYYKVEQLSNSEKYLDALSTAYYFVHGRTVSRGSIVFAKRGGAIALNKVRLLAQESFMDTNMMALTPSGRLHNEYLYYALSHIGLWRFADTTSVPQINNKHVNPLPFPLPKLFEQRAIAEALSDVDALLTGLDLLISKKRELKRSAMQQLLTGETRLPGWSGEWKRKPLGAAIGDLVAGVSVNSVAGEVSPSTTDAVILKTSAVAAGKFYPAEAKGIDPVDLNRVKLSPKAETVLISRMNTIDLVGECGYIDADYPNHFIPDRLWMTRFRPGAEISARWLAFALGTPSARTLLRNIATGTSGSMKNISKSTFLDLEFAIPTLSEQTAIAEVLADMDAELAALEARRAKTLAIKQAMMQELLTGKTRLVPAGDAHA